MAPSTSGIKMLDANSSHELCQQALDVAHKVLKPNGTLVMVPLSRAEAHETRALPIPSRSSLSSPLSADCVCLCGQKIFQGAGFSPLFKQVQASFLSTHTLKPVSTRGESVETFIIAQRRKFPDKIAAEQKQQQQQQQTAAATQPIAQQLQATQQPSNSKKR